MKTAEIRLTPSDQFIAVLSDGRRIERDEIDDLATALHAAGITADSAYCGDWREGDAILMSGQIIALKWALRRLAYAK